MKISNEIVNKLKEGGLIRRDLRCSFCIENNYKSCSACDAIPMEPTLSELIEACLKRPIFVLELQDAALIQKRWHCTNGESFGYGSNPEEAVARMLLEQYKKYPLITRENDEDEDILEKPEVEDDHYKDVTQN
tara:strand:+ start:2094 stop:2492 length:399 start_codon:yes stop_codon:yes gene_type:complete